MGRGPRGTVGGSEKERPTGSYKLIYMDWKRGEGEEAKKRQEEEGKGRGR